MFLLDLLMKKYRPRTLGLLFYKNLVINYQIDILIFTFKQEKMNNQEINKNLIKFWDNAIKLTPEEKKEETKGDYKDLAPSIKLFNAAQELGKCEYVLDYGCGSGWAAIIIAKSGAKKIRAVDLGDNIIDTAKFYAELYGVGNNLDILKISPDWFETVPYEIYDGIICSNVLDVVPLETSLYIIKELARIATKDAKVIIGLNFYLSKEDAKNRGLELIEDKYLIINGTLRLLSLTDEKWTQLFSPYFEVESLEYFAWPGESKETRRLFRLKRR